MKPSPGLLGALGAAFLFASPQAARAYCLPPCPEPFNVPFPSGKNPSASSKKPPGYSGKATAPKPKKKQWWGNPAFPPPPPPSGASIGDAPLNRTAAAAAEGPPEYRFRAALEGLSALNDRARPAEERVQAVQEFVRRIKDLPPKFQEDGDRALKAAFEKHRDSAIRGVILEAFGVLGRTGRVETISLELTTNTAPETRAAAARALGALKDRRGLKSLHERLTAERAPSVVDAVLDAVLDIGAPESIDPLLYAWFVLEQKAVLEKPPAAPVADAGAGPPPSFRSCRDRLPEILKEMTGQEFGADRAAWQKWWNANRATFPAAREKEAAAKKEKPQGEGKGVPAPAAPPAR